MSMENVLRMVNSLCASIPRGIDVHGKAVHGHGYTGVTTQRHWYPLPPPPSVQSTQPGRSPLERRTTTGAAIRYSRRPGIISRPPSTRTISSQRELRHESPRERLFARRPRNSRRFSAFVVGHTWPKPDSTAATGCRPADSALVLPTDAESETNSSLSTTTEVSGKVCG